MVHYRNSLKTGKEYEESHVFGYEEKYWEAIRKERMSTSTGLLYGRIQPIPPDR